MHRQRIKICEHFLSRTVGLMIYYNIVTTFLEYYLYIPTTVKVYFFQSVLALNRNIVREFSFSNNTFTPMHQNWQQ